VSGSQRAMFFKRPIVPMMQSDPKTVVMQMPQARQGEETMFNYDDEQVAAKIKNASVQTAFRESTAQTDP